MKNTTSDKPISKPRSSPVRVIVAIALLIVAIAIVGVSIPARQTNKAENFQGGGKSEAVSEVLYYRGGENLRLIPKVQVTKVEYTPKGDKCSDPNSGNSYTVTTRSISLFGIAIDRHTDNVCDLFNAQ